MLKKSGRFVVLLLALVFAASGLTQAQAQAAGPVKKVYEVNWATEDLSTPAKWVQSPYFNNPLYKETRFGVYWPGTPIPPGGPRETSFYMVYREDGLYMFFQANEWENDATGNLKGSDFEFFVVPGEGDLAYHQMIVPTAGGEIQYYEWQTENRNNRPLKGSVKVNSAQIPTGWGTVVVIPWENVYDNLPLNGGNWQFNLIRWSPSDGQTWGGHVHQPGKFNLLHFQAPTAEQRTAIQKYTLARAWNEFQTKSAELTATWLNNPVTQDKAFYNKVVLPLIVAGSVNGPLMDRLGSLNAIETEELFSNVPDWMELRYNVDDQRMTYLKKSLMNSNPDNTAPVTEAVVSGTKGSGDWYVSNASVALSAEDDNSGVAATEYALTVVQSTYGVQSTPGFVPYTAPIVLSDGVYGLQYRSADNADNIEDVKSLALQIDATAPTFAVSANGSPLADGAEFQDSQAISFTVQAADNLSGVAQQAITVDGTEYVSGTALDWAGKLGTHVIQVIVKDQAGNTSQSVINVNVKTSYASIEQLLESYIASGDISGPLQNQLTNKFEQAMDQLSKGHHDQAIKHLEDFLKLIGNPPQQDNISAEAKAVLVADVNALIQS